MQEDSKDKIHVYYGEYYRSLFNYGIKLINNEDVVRDGIQDCFYNLWMNPEKLERIEKPRNYLIGTLRNLLLKQIASAKNSSGLDEIHAFEVSTQEAIIDSEIEAINSQKLQRAIDTLTPKQKEVLYLRFYEGLSYEEIEQITSTNYQSARNLLSKTIKNLRKAVLVFLMFF
ncbi:sigma-70 family RNA polymerase sigma factor [Reichenbachiella sp. MALMAid0571]|uniref:RNA polymerase sigma factor n=1 Tax=Reichenbachiella sp. MALMAid0571 TaxID=3143939 RepID=UPI0032DF2395